MKIGIRSSHAYSNMGGGYQALRWHIQAFLSLGHEVTFYTTNTPSQGVLQNWFDKVPIRFYSQGVEKNYDLMFNCDHFDWALPLAKKNIAHVFFPHEKLAPPPPEVTLYSNSAYTARHILHQWGREVAPMYIPIDNFFHSGNKENIILHVSRITEPSVWADKAHRQMINAFKLIAKQLSNWKLVIAGSLDRDQQFYFSELIRLASGYNIDFRPDLSQNELTDLFSRSSIYWHMTGVSLPTIPGAQEHMGITPLEAQASGCVPIVYNSGGMPEVVMNHQTGLLFDNVLDLPHMTVELLKDMTAWAQMSQAGQAWAQSWKDFDAFVGRVEDMLNDRPITPLKPLQLILNHSPEQVTAVIPTYNSPLLQQCLDSLKATAPTMKVLIINNGESLANLRVDDNVRVTDAGANLGFAGAHRLASSLVETPLVLMLNDDVIADKAQWLEQLLFVMNNKEVGVVGPKLRFPNGTLQFAGGIVDWNRDDIGYHRNYGGNDGVEYSTPQEVPFITGAALLCRKELYNIPEELINTLNYEDTWMCFEARKRGFRVIFQPASCLTHFESETKKRLPEIQEKTDAAKKIFSMKWSSVALDGK